MKARNFIALAAAAFLLSACIPSVHPFYTDKNVVFEPRLLGEWQPKEDADKPETWKFEKGEERTYKLTVMEKEGRHGELSARLFKLQEEYFLDLTPTDCKFATNEAGLVTAAMFPGHLLMRVTQFEPGLKLAFCDYEWLEKHLEAKPNSLAHHKGEQRLVLTARTSDLQQFVLEHLGEDGLFQKPSEMVRKKN